MCPRSQEHNIDAELVYPASSEAGYTSRSGADRAKPR